MDRLESRPPNRHCDMAGYEAVTCWGRGLEIPNTHLAVGVVYRGGSELMEYGHVTVSLPYFYPADCVRLSQKLCHYVSSRMESGCVWCRKGMNEHFFILGDRLGCFEVIKSRRSLR